MVFHLLGTIQSSLGDHGLRYLTKTRNDLIWVFKKIGEKKQKMKTEKKSTCDGLSAFKKKRGIIRFVLRDAWTFVRTYSFGGIQGIME
jgi:hypothetical protein